MLAATGYRLVFMFPSHTTEKLAAISLSISDGFMACNEVINWEAFANRRRPLALCTLASSVGKKGRPILARSLARGQKFSPE